MLFILGAGRAPRLPVSVALNFPRSLILIKYLVTAKREKITLGLSNLFCIDQHSL